MEQKANNRQTIENNGNNKKNKKFKIFMTSVKDPIKLCTLAKL